MNTGLLLAVCLGALLFSPAVMAEEKVPVSVFGVHIGDLEAGNEPDTEAEKVSVLRERRESCLRVRRRNVLIGCVAGVAVAGCYLLWENHQGRHLTRSDWGPALAVTALPGVLLGGLIGFLASENCGL